MSVVDSPPVERPLVDRTNLHRIWKAILISIALVVATACYFIPVLLVVLGVLLVLLLMRALGLSGSRPLHSEPLCSGHPGL